MTLPTKELIDLLTQRRVYDLAKDLYLGMPVFPSLPPYTMTLVAWHGERVWPDGYMGSDEFITMCNHTGTHLDALCHGSKGGKFFDGKPIDQSRQGFASHGIETVAPIIRRGVMLDVAGLLGVDVLAPAHEVTVEEMQAACARQKTPIGRGDVVLIRTGWMRHWDRPSRYLGVDEPRGMPGPSAAGGTWLADQGIWGGGSDTIAFELLIPPPEVVPVHRVFLAERGVFMLEAVNLEELARDRVYEFVFVGAPIKLRGATGAPIRPMALV